MHTHDFELAFITAVFPPAMLLSSTPSDNKKGKLHSMLISSGLSDVFNLSSRLIIDHDDTVE